MLSKSREHIYQVQVRLKLFSKELYGVAIYSLSSLKNFSGVFSICCSLARSNHFSIFFVMVLQYIITNGLYSLLFWVSIRCSYLFLFIPFENFENCTNHYQRMLARSTTQLTTQHLKTIYISESTQVLIIVCTNIEIPSNILI